MMKENVLGELARIFNGKTPARNEQRDYGHPVLKIKDISEDGEFRGSFGSFVESSFAEKYSQKQVRAGDVLVLNSAHNAEHVGTKRFKATPSVEGSIATGEWLIARSDDPRLVQDYLWYWFQLPTTRFEIKRKVRGIHLYPRDVSDLRIPLPSIDEQHRIATILDKTDAIRRKCEQLLILADNLLKSTFLEMFFGKNSDWPKVPLKSVAELINGDRSRNYPSGNDIVGKGIIFLSTKNIDGSRLVFDTTEFITPEKFSTFSRGKLQRNDLVITLRGSIGQCAIFDSVYETGFINAQMMIIRPSSEVLPKYLHGLIVHPFVQNKLISIKSGSAIPQLTAKQIGELDIPLPPIAMQREFSIFAEKVERMEKHLRKNITQASDLFASLSHRAFRGELQGVVCD